MGRRFLKILISAAIIVILINTGCSKKEPVSDTLGLGVTCNNAYWQVNIAREDNGRLTDSKADIYFKNGVYKIEVYTGPDSPAQEMILNGKDLYLLNFDTQAAFLHDFNKNESKFFLRKAFITLGQNKQGKKIAGKDKIGQYKCSIIEYSMYKNEHNNYLKTVVKEWREKKSGLLVKAETKTLRSMTIKNSKEVIIEPITEEYTIHDYVCSEYPDSKFSVPKDMKVINIDILQKTEMEKRGIIPENNSKKITVK